MRLPLPRSCDRPAVKARALLFVNPRSRRGRDRKAEAISTLAAHDIEVVDVSAVAPGSLSSFVREQKDIDRIVVGGGDGTLNRLLEALVELKLPVGILPLGTANDLATTMKLPADLNGACEVIAQGHLRRIDLGSVNGKYFVNEGSLGLSNQIVRDLNPIAKKHFGIFAILGNVIRVVSRARRFRARLRCDAKIADVSTLQITVGNGERFGGFINVGEADITDHRLDLYSLEVRRFRDVVKLLPALVRGRYRDIPGVRLERGREIEVETDRPRPVYTDGEFATATPALFQLVPSALAVFAPLQEP